ncbi:uncharacterized protein LOC144115870 [Amblyomma americanum]
MPREGPALARPASSAQEARVRRRPLCAGRGQAGPCGAVAQRARVRGLYPQRHSHRRPAHFARVSLLLCPAERGHECPCGEPREFISVSAVSRVQCQLAEYPDVDCSDEGTDGGTLGGLVLGPDEWLPADGWMEAATTPLATSRRPHPAPPTSSSRRRRGPPASATGVSGTLRSVRPRCARGPPACAWRTSGCHRRPDRVRPDSQRARRPAFGEGGMGTSSEGCVYFDLVDTP